MHKAHKKKKKRGKQGNNRPAGGKENVLPPESVETPEIALEASAPPVERKLPDEKLRNGTTADANKVPPYEIQASDIMGRYLVASRDLKPGEVIITADPLIVGPCAGCKLICLGCYLPIINNYSKCKQCSWPVCGDSCPGLHQPLGHSREECAALRQHTTPDYSDVLALKDLYQTIAPLRCLLLKSSDPEKWETINTMVAHNEIRRNKSELWRNNQLMVVDKIISTWGMSQYTEDEIHTVCGILEVNAFEVGQSGVSIRALYPRAFLLAHDCTPNTTHTDDYLRRLTVRASTAIAKGKPITLSYAYTLQSTMKRQEHLLENKFFSCSCSRCSDPTELGTYVGALLCPRCPDARGIVVPARPLDLGAPWNCNLCPDYVISADAVRALVQRINDEYDSIDINDISRYEAFLLRYRNVLHGNHFLRLTTQHTLSQLYGRAEGQLIQDMSPAALKHKRDICRHILAVFDILEPGYSRLRGVTLYELHAPLMILTTRDFENKQINKNELRVRLKEVVKCLHESARILSTEPKESSEGIMATAAIDALRRIKDWEKIIGKIM